MWVCQLMFAWVMLKQLNLTRTRGFGVVVYFGQKKGAASSTDISPQAIEDTVKAACNIAQCTSEDACAGLADKDLMASKEIDLDLYHPWQIDMDQVISQAKDCEQVARDFSTKIFNSEGASIDTYLGCNVYANSHGFIGVKQGTRHSKSCCVIAKEGDDMQRDYWYSISREPHKLEDAHVIGEKAAKKAIARLNAQKLKTIKTPVVFHSEISAGIINQCLAAAAGTQIYRKASFLVDQLNKPVFPNWGTNRRKTPFKKSIVLCSI